MPRWFDKDPKRLAYELQKLDEAGLTYSIMDDGMGSGALRLSIVYPDPESPGGSNQTHSLIGAFPEEYPDLPFEIWVQPGSNFPPGPHLNPNGNLCLLQDPGNRWNGSKDYLAAFLQHQVRDILRVHRGDNTVPEAQEGLRQTGYIQYAPGTALLVGDWVVPADVDRGTFLWRHFPLDSAHEYGRGVMTEIRTADGRVLGQLSLGKTWDSLLHASREAVGRWVRLSSIPRGADPLAEARAIWPELEKPAGTRDLTGLIIPEEAEKGGNTIHNWVFCLRTPLVHPQSKRLLTNHTLIRAEQFSNESRWARAPRATHIATKKALVIGLGAIGAPLAWQLARAGIGELRCVDFDSVQIGNLPRWLYGMPEIGKSKSASLAANLQLSYPPLICEGIEHRIGAIVSTPAQYARYQASLNEVDILVDATAEIAVNQHLQNVAREKNIPYVWAYGSPGGWGGVIGRSVPGRTEGCYECVQYRMRDAGIYQGKQTPGAPSPIILPPSENLPDVQPVGCFHPTFRGTGFDMDQVSEMAARLVVATLCQDANANLDCYPDFPWDVAVLSQWDAEIGKPTVPNWTTYTLDRHGECQNHGD